MRPALGQHHGRSGQQTTERTPGRWAWLRPRGPLGAAAEDGEESGERRGNACGHDTHVVAADVGVAGSHRGARAHGIATGHTSAHVVAAAHGLVGVHRIARARTVAGVVMAAAMERADDGRKRENQVTRMLRNTGRLRPTLTPNWQDSTNIGKVGSQSANILPILSNVWPMFPTSAKVWPTFRRTWPWLNLPNDKLSLTTVWPKLA